MTRRTVLLGSLVGLLIAMLPGPLPVQAQGGKPNEYDIKAAFIYNFLRYIEYPAQAFPAGSSTLNIAVLGKDPFGPHLDTLTNKSIQGRRLVIKRINDVREIGEAQVLFVSASEKARLKPILDSLQNRPVLTIGETGGFARSGGIINFTIENNSVRFEVNPDAAERAKLKVSSQLLKLAKVVRS